MSIESPERIGVAQLSHHGSELVRAAENGTMYEVVRHGKSTGVVLARADVVRPPERVTVSLDDLYGIFGDRLPEEAIGTRLSELEEGRDADGVIGGRR